LKKNLEKKWNKTLKTGSFPAKADHVIQSNFYDNVLTPLMGKDKNRLIKLLFMDASHFVMGGDYRPYILGKVRRFIKTFSGRMRYNLLGGLNYVTKKVTTITNNQYINAISVFDFLKKISVEYAGKPIHVILDNARYQKCKVVQELADQLGINLESIPPYSPNLNLIERFWKHVKSRLRTRYYGNFDLFCENIESIVSRRDNSDKVAIDKLICDKVQMFDDLVRIHDTTFGDVKKTA
jgi:transposase